MRQREKYRREFDRLVEELENDCDNLLIEMCSYAMESIPSNNIKHSFTDWTEILFSRINQRPPSEVDWIAMNMSCLKKTIKKIGSDAKYFDNPMIHEKYNNNIKNIVYHCSMIETLLRKSRYEECKKIIIGDFKEAVSSISETMSDHFKREYNEEEFAN